MEPALLDVESLMAGLGQKPSGKNRLAFHVRPPPHAHRHTPQHVSRCAQVNSPSIVLPRLRQVPEHIRVTVAAVSASNSFRSEPYDPSCELAPREPPPEEVWLDTLALHLDGTSIVSSSDWALLERPADVTVEFMRCLQQNYVRVPSIQVSVALPAVSLRLDRLVFPPPLSPRLPSPLPLSLDDLADCQQQHLTAERVCAGPHTCYCVKWWMTTCPLRLRCG